MRGDQVVREPDIVASPSGDFEEVQSGRIAAELQNVANQLFDTSRPVDEYQSTSSALSLEVLPEYEIDELIDTIVISANEIQGGTPRAQFQSATTVGTTGANPTAKTTVTSQALTAGFYTVSWSCMLTGTLLAADDNNFGLYNGTTLVAQSMSGHVASTPYVQPAVNVIIPTGGATLSIENIAQPGNASVYVGQLTTTFQGILNVVTLQLGQRLWYITMDDYGGTFVLQGMGLRLSRHDRRIVSQPVAGPLSFELMGHADTRGGW